MKDKKRVNEEPEDIKKLKNKEGRFIIFSKHKACGTQLTKFCGKEEAEKIAKFLGKSLDKLSTHVKKGGDMDLDEKEEDECNYAYTESKEGSAQKKKHRGKNSKSKSKGKQHKRKNSKSKSKSKGKK